MPKKGMEHLRREALTRAAIIEIAQTGVLDLTVARIASRAGVSSALAHHYFGSKRANSLRLDPLDAPRFCQ